ncbi:MAG: hypothetical protein ABRQ38_21790 [Candidatus Eremiobacterota bacterium]
MPLYIIWSSGYYYSHKPFNTGRNILISIFFIQYLLVAILTPSFTCGAISGEKERKTYELLITTLLTPMDIVTGKVLYSMSYCFLFIFSSLPVTCTALFFGGVSPWEILLFYILLFVSALFFILCGIYFSALFNSTGAAIRTTYLTIYITGSFIIFIPLLITHGTIQNQFLPFIFFLMPTWLFMIINILFLTILFFIAAVNLIDKVTIKPSSAFRIVSSFFFIYNLFPVTGTISRHMAPMTEIKDISEMIAMFFAAIIGISLLFIMVFSCDFPRHKTGSFLKNLFYPDNVSSIFFVPLLGTLASLLFSSVCVYVQPVLTSMMAKILLSSLFIFFILMTFSLMGRCFLYFSGTRKIYAQLFLAGLIILITVMPVCIHARNHTINHPFTLMEFTFLNPLFGVVSLWIPDDIDSIVSVTNRSVPIYIISFISYVLLLIFFSTVNYYLRKKWIT